MSARAGVTRVKAVNTVIAMENPTTPNREHALTIATLSFDFIVNPSVTNHRSRHQRDLQSSSVNSYFLDNRKQKYR
jgi:hypothetical protein